MKRPLATLALALLALELALAIVTGDRGLLGPVTATGFVVRAILLGIALVARTRAVAARPLAWPWLALLLLLLPTLVQFQYAGGRINGDGIMYYVYVHSIAKDGDVDLANEYEHYGLLTRGDLAMPTKTGLRRSIFSVGPAVVWLPFFAVGEVVARGQQAVGLPADLSGYGPCHRNAVALGSLLYGFGALLLIHSLLRRHFAAGTALFATLVLWGTTFLHWYMVQQPTTSHATSAFGGALALFLWDRFREQGPSLRNHAILGLAIGIAMCLRWQNGVLLVLPGLDLLGPAWRAWTVGPRRPRLLRVAGCGALLGAGVLVGAFPQMLTWKALYGMYLLPYPPHGRDFVRLDHPFVLETFFSSRHGLLSWTPAFWAGYLGFLPFARRRPALAAALAIPLVLMTYVNLCSGDWWAGGSFSNRRFDSLLPILAFGFAAAIDAAERFLRHRGGIAVALLVSGFALWNALLVEQVRRGLVPRDDTVEFPALARNGWRILAHHAGSPNTWPASWVFAWRFGRPPGQYDLLVGRYLFYRQENMGGHVEIGAPGDDVMLGDGWGPIEAPGVRRVRGEGHLLAPLDVPEDLLVHVRGHAEIPADVVLVVNGIEAGRFGRQGPGTSTVRVGRDLWQRELNDVALRVDAGDLAVDAVDFERVP